MSGAYFPEVQDADEEAHFSFAPATVLLILSCMTWGGGGVMSDWESGSWSLEPFRGMWSQPIMPQTPGRASEYPGAPHLWIPQIGHGIPWSFGTSPTHSLTALLLYQLPMSVKMGFCRRPVSTHRKAAQICRPQRRPLGHTEAAVKGKGRWAEVGLAVQGPGKVCKPQPSATRRSIEEPGNLELPNTPCQQRPSSLVLAIPSLTHIGSGHCGKDEISQAKKQNQGYYDIKKKEKKFPQNFHWQYSKSNNSIWVLCFGHTSLLMWRMEFFSEDTMLCLTGVQS